MCTCMSIPRLSILDLRDHIIYISLYDATGFASFAIHWKSTIIEVDWNKFYQINKLIKTVTKRVPTCISCKSSFWSVAFMVHGIGRYTNHGAHGNEFRK